VVLSMLSVLALPVDAQEDCLPVGDTSAANVEVCGVTLDGGSVAFDVRADESDKVYVAVSDMSKKRDHGATTEIQLQEGVNEFSLDAPARSNIVWSAANLDGYARGVVNSESVDYGSPSWLELVLSLVAGVLGVLSNVLVAVLIVLRGRSAYLRRLW
jgi:hypothetical protein